MLWRIATVIVLGLVSATAAADVPLNAPAPEDTTPQRSSVPPTTKGPASDNEAPKQTRRPSYYGARREEEAPPKTPGNGFGLGIGFAFGGDTLATVMFQNGSSDSLKAGEGLTLDLIAMGTPFWATDTVGFGFGGELALKYRSVGGSGGSISFRRFPVIGFGQMLARTGPHGAFLLRAGVETDLAPHVGGDGIATGVEADLSSNVGFVGDIGLWYQSSSALAMTFTFRFNRMSYSFDGNQIAATNAGLMVGFLLDPR